MLCYLDKLKQKIGAFVLQNGIVYAEPEVGHHKAGETIDLNRDLLPLFEEYAEAYHKEKQLGKAVKKAASMANEDQAKLMNESWAFSNRSLCCNDVIQDLDDGKGNKRPACYKCQKPV